MTPTGDPLPSWKDGAAKDGGGKDSGGKDTAAKDSGSKDSGSKDSSSKESSSKDSSSKDGQFPGVRIIRRVTIISSEHVVSRRLIRQTEE